MLTAQSVCFDVLFALQTGLEDFDVDIDLGEGLAGGAVSAFLTTLVVGAILVAIAPAYTERMMDALEDEPVDAFVTGVLALVGLIVVIFFLVITILGILLAIPLILAAILVWAVGAAIAFLLIADRLVGHDDGWAKPLVVGALLNGALALTGLGGLVGFCVGAAGFGVLIRDWRSRRRA
jgi:hypothetical protein